MTYRVFVDLETTGLLESDLILEVGMVICVENQGMYNPVEAEEWLHHFTIDDMNARDIDPIVLEMHQKTGLWGVCATDPDATRTYTAMQGRILHFLDVTIGSEKPLMCGSGVHFDRAFLKRLMPKVEARFHYRNLDTSTLRTMYKDVTGDSELPYPNMSTHRALDDCYAAINDVNFYAGLLTGALHK